MNKWALCVLLFLATTLNYLDRQTLGILAPIIQTELRLDNAALGTLFAVFYYTYTVAQFGIGGILDRSHLRWAYGIAVLAWSAVAALTSLANTFAMLIVFRLLLGIAESVNWPAAMRIVARALPPSERSLGNGIFTSGTSIGALIAPGLVLGLVATIGWRWSFVVVGSFGVLWFVLWMLMTRSPSLDPVWRSDPADVRVQSAGAYREVLQNRQFWRVFIVTILVNPCLYFSVNWLPTYFVQERGVKPGSELGWILTLIYLGLDLGYLFSGGGVLLLTKWRWPLGRARKTVFLTAAVLLASCGLVPFASTLNMAVILLVVVNFGAGAWISMYLTMAQEVSDQYVSTAAGLLGGSGSLAGAVAMWGVGVVTQRTSSFAAPMLAISIAAALAAFAGLAVTRGKEPTVHTSKSAHTTV